jgi:hypothetical protein
MATLVVHNHGRGYSSSTKVTFMFTRYWTILPFSTTTFCSWIHAQAHQSWLPNLKKFRDETI